MRGPEFQSLNIHRECFGGAKKTSDKDQGYKEGDTCVISREYHLGPNANRRVARVASEPVDTTNDKIGHQQKTTNSKAFVGSVASHSLKTIYLRCRH